MPKKHTVKSRKTTAQKAPKSIASTGNVFADIGFKNAGELALKSDMVWYINREIEARGLTQAEAGALLGINQPKVERAQTWPIDRLLGRALTEIPGLARAEGGYLDPPGSGRRRYRC